MSPRETMGDSRPVPIFVRILRGELQDNICAIYGETPKMYYVKVYSDGKHQDEILADVHELRKELYALKKRA